MMLSIDDFAQRIPSRLERIIADSWGRGSDVRLSGSIPFFRQVWHGTEAGEEAPPNQVLLALDPEEKLTLRTIFRFFGLKPFMQSSLEKEGLSGGIAGAELARGLAGLRKRGIVFGFARTWGEPVFAVPMESAAGWHQQLFVDSGASVIWQDEPQRGGFVPLQPKSQAKIHAQGCRDLLFEVLFSLRYFAANEVKLTRSGVVSKRHLSKWAQQLELEAETLRPLSLEYVSCEAYPDHLALILDILLKLRLIEIQNDCLKPRPLRVQGWLSLSADEMRQVLYRVWKKISLLRLPVWLQHFVMWLERQPAGGPVFWTDALQWLSAHDLLPNRHVEESMIKTDGDRAGKLTEEQQLWKEAAKLWIMPMRAFGWLEMSGEDAHSIVLQPVFSPLSLNNASSRQQHLPEAEAACFVQPDYEVIVPPDVSFSIHWHLDAMAERAVSDTVAIYRLSRKSVQQAFAEGYTANDCLAFLRAIAKTGIPEHVEQTISQWGCAAEGQVSNTKSMTAVKADRLFRTWPAESLPAEEAEMRFANEGEAQGIMLTDYYWSSWPVDSQIPGDDELFPGWRDNPLKWYRQLQSYHSSTYKEMVRQAIAWKAHLKLLANDKEFRLLPLSVQERDGGWFVKGLENGREAVHDPANWQAIQILLPGIS
ncbi:helicase-associated domain-containing protein [Paenibacillus senegalensis]|uniref:helicase-associated domain-containing protein n=1 Tax=Paenibacillus senegalensis TaxID=1465766 RepID=UPI000288F672|nr:helicase-associated domain-containing protein [Paenibacillus senegalensis]